MIILDTNVLSALMRQSPDPKVVAWLDRQPRSSIWTTAISVLEVRFGLEITSSGKRRSSLVRASDALLAAIGGRVAPFDAGAAEAASDLMASRHRKGRPGDLRDTMIAGIAVARHAALATRNVAHFEDISVPLINPWMA